MFRNIFIAVIVIAVSVVFISVSNTGSAQYDAHGKRDPFLSLIGPERSAAIKLEDIVSSEDLRLEGIALGQKGKNTAIMNGEIVKPGDKFGEVEIKDISTRSVVVELGGKTYEIKLPEQGGAK